MLIEMKILDERLLDAQFAPGYAKVGDAGIDLRVIEYDDSDWSCRASGELDCLLLKPGKQVIVRTGISVHINNPDVTMLIVPRSGLGTKGLVIGNLTGVIDSGYQGEIQICLWNRSDNVIVIKELDRVAQALFVPIIRPTFKIVDEFSTISERGSGGFGSSGVA